MELLSPRSSPRPAPSAPRPSRLNVLSVSAKRAVTEEVVAAVVSAADAATEVTEATVPSEAREEAMLLLKLKKSNKKLLHKVV